MSVYIDCLSGWSVCFGESQFKDNMVCIRGGPTFAGHLECHFKGSLIERFHMYCQVSYNEA